MRRFLYSLLTRRTLPSVQRVYAVGMPPENKICFFRDLMNVAVLPAVGTSFISVLLRPPISKSPF